MKNLFKIKQDFPIFKNHPKLVYLDNAATAQKPKSVIDAIAKHYEHNNANIHRGIYKLSEQATEAYEAARVKVAKFIGAESPEQIIFTKNTTEAINLVAYSFARKNLKSGDEILLTLMEHHSNIVPWQMIAKEKKLKIRFVNITHDGELDINDFKSKLNEKTKLFAVTHASNVLGTINPVQKITEICHSQGIPVLVDGAQATPHFPVNVSALKCDFYAFSGHKMLAPTGIGVLYISKKYLNILPPFLGGGDMIKSITKKEMEFQEAPARFEAGTPAIEAAIGLEAAIDYLNNISMPAIQKHEQKLVAYALQKLEKINDIAVYGSKNPAKRAGVISFNLAGVHPHDLASLLDEQNIAIRAGHHCAMPLHQFLKIPASARMSFYIYNTKKDIDILCEALIKISKNIQ